MKHGKKIFINSILGLLFVLIFGYIVYSPLQKLHNFIFHKKQLASISINDTNDIIYVDLYNVIVEDTPNTLDTYGTIIGKQEQAIIFEHGGRISYIGEKGYVKKGDVYISLDTTQLELKKKSLEAQLQSKKNYLKSLNELHKSALVSTAQVEEVKMKILELEFHIQEADVQMTNMILTAPTNGYFFVKNTASSVGSMVQGRQELGYFFSEAKQIKFFINHDILTKLKENEEIKVLFFPDFDSGHKQLEGSLKFNLSFIRPMTASENEHNNSLCEAKADLTNSEDVLPMFYNQNGKIRIIFNDKSSNCLIPEAAILYRGVKSFVYVVQDDRVILTEIFPISTINGYVRINQANISSETVIVLRGLNKLYHMAKINVNIKKDA